MRVLIWTFIIKNRWRRWVLSNRDKIWQGINPGYFKTQNLSLSNVNAIVVFQTAETAIKDPYQIWDEDEIIELHAGFFHSFSYFFVRLSNDWLLICIIIILIFITIYLFLKGM